MNYKHLFGILILFILCLACSTNNQVEFGKEKDIVISGNISNYEIGKSPKTIEINRRDFFHLNEKIVEKIDKNGHFKFKFPIAFAEESHLYYGELDEYGECVNMISSILCIPGDSIHIEIENKILKAEKPFKHLKFSGSNTGITNQQVNLFLDNISNNNTNIEEFKKTFKELSSKEFKIFLEQKQIENYSRLKEFQKGNKTTELFNFWAKDHLKYKSWIKMMSYKSNHASLNEISIDNVKLHENYFAFLNDYNLKDNNLISIAQGDFLNSYYRYSYLNPKDSFKKFLSTSQKEGFVKAFPILKSTLELNTYGLTKDLFLAKHYLRYLQQGIDTFGAVYDPNFTNQSYFLNTISKQYDKMKNGLSSLDSTISHFPNIKPSTIPGILDSISQVYKNKIIYIDFWAPWCGPCMDQIPFLKEIQEEFTNNDVVFLFLANSCSQDSWKATIANKKLAGEHILLTDDQFYHLAEKLSFEGIPHYTLIDRNGNIVLKNAPKPSTKIKLIEEIKKHLD